MKKNDKKRVLWVDIAKALAILSVPVCHTLSLNSMFRSVLFVFNMPLFFILSGYTTKLATTWQKFFERLKKNFLWTFIPIVLVFLVAAVSRSVQIFGDITQSPQLFWQYITEIFSGDPDNTAAGANAVWFLLSLFSAKVIMDIVNILIKSEKNGLIFIIGGIIGCILGVNNIRLPWFFDLTLVGMMFMEIGMLWNKHQTTIKKYSTLLVGAAIFFVALKLQQGEYIEMYIRSYPDGLWTLVEGIAATYVVCYLVEMFEEAAMKGGKIYSRLAAWLYILGANTIFLYIFHSIDDAFVDIWRVGPGTHIGDYISIVIRLVIDIAGFMVLYHGFKLLSNRRKGHKHLKK